MDEVGHLLLEEIIWPMTAVATGRCIIDALTSDDTICFVYSLEVFFFFFWPDIKHHPLAGSVSCVLCLTFSNLDV